MFLEEANNSVQNWQRGRRTFFGIVFSRKALVIGLVLLQVFGLWVLFAWLTRYVVYVYGFFLVAETALMVYIINRNDNPGFQISWLVMITAVPVVGALFYLYVHTQVGARKVQKRLRQNIQETAPYLQQDPSILEELKAADPESLGVARYVAEYGGYPVYKNTEVRYYTLGEYQFEEMLRQLETAQRFIFIEYFIVDRGYMWDRVLEILRRKVQEGVEVRFMYDGTNTLRNLPVRYPQTLRSYGIQCRIFAPVRPVFTTVQNNRDHRKIVVIDGHTGFTGGVNLADEYINRKERFGHWKDTAVMLRGEAVTSLTMMFLQMWDLAGEPVSSRRYILPKEQLSRTAPGFVMPYGDSPLDAEPVGELVYMDIISRARKYVHICTPYLILDNEMILALQFAAKRGVDVRVIMPHIPDKEYAYRLARVNYEELIPSGVQIYEYEPGFVHAKSFVSDDRCATVGTVNLDYRSLYLHFECGVYMTGTPAVAEVEKDFQETLKRCIRITEEDLQAYPWYKRLSGYLMRVLAPLM